MSKTLIDYKSYLKLERLLTSQEPLSLKVKNPIHDEWLFVISHQVYELWFKQILLEFESIISLFYKEDVVKIEDMNTIFLRFQRVIKIQKLLIKELEVLETIETVDFLGFRDFLRSASGLQSFQFRLIEGKFGLQEKTYLDFHKKVFSTFFSKEEKQKLEKSQRVNLFYGVQQWLETMPFIESSGSHFENEYIKKLDHLYKNEKVSIEENKDLSEEEKRKNIYFLTQLQDMFHKIMGEQTYKELQKKGLWRLSHLALKSALMIQVYGKEGRFKNSYFFLPSRIIEALIEVDHQLAIWRFRHALMVVRVIGMRPGTGGSMGSDYLFETVKKHRVYQDFIQLRPFFLPRSFLPQLPLA